MLDTVKGTLKLTNDTTISEARHPLNRGALMAALGVVFGDIGTSVGPENRILLNLLHIAG